MSGLGRVLLLLLLLMQTDESQAGMCPVLSNRSLTLSGGPVTVHPSIPLPSVPPLYISLIKANDKEGDMGLLQCPPYDKAC
ncbi:hypothetical protein NHX12_029204 [Muraenolepis orangiensis]|uniref:Uncharacterized protein n=1 Tax=Muraenolepis orangiensis TaxID=630683 RepID=A0A9Q0IMY4_9TELE|nr:hypothetical protein NHX12_029204 [Muraenolepis orangiensis]